MPPSTLWTPHSPDPRDNGDEDERQPLGNAVNRGAADQPQLVLSPPSRGYSGHALIYYVAFISVLSTLILLVRLFYDGIQSLETNLAVQASPSPAGERLRSTLREVIAYHRDQRLRSAMNIQDIGARPVRQCSNSART